MSLHTTYYNHKEQQFVHVRQVDEEVPGEIPLIWGVYRPVAHSGVHSYASPGDVFVLPSWVEIA